MKIPTILKTTLAATALIGVAAVSPVAFAQEQHPARTLLDAASSLIAPNAQAQERGERGGPPPHAESSSHGRPPHASPPHHGRPPHKPPRHAPPPRRHEKAPPPRRGYVWIPGHWTWGWDGRGYAYIWTPGVWEKTRAGYRYVEPRWVLRGGEWVFTGGWSR